MWSSTTTPATATVRRTVVSTFVALALTAALPQAGLAMTTSEAGLWKITKSNIGSTSSTVVIERVRQGEKLTGGNTFLVINKGKAYLATATVDASSANSIKAVDYSAWSSGMKLVRIGSNVRAIDDCGVRCKFGVVGNRMTVTFRTVKPERQRTESVLALEKE